MLTPGDSFTTFWTLLLIIVTLIDVILGPFYVSFFKNQDDPQNLIIDVIIFIEIIFLFDVLINFRTAYYEKGILIVDKR